MQSFEERSVRSWSEESNGTKLGAKKSHFLRSRSLPRPALLSCPLVPFDAWLSATRCARSRARHTPSPRRPRTPQRTSRRNAAVPTMPPWAGASVESCRFVARRSLSFLPPYAIAATHRNSIIQVYDISIRSALVSHISLANTSRPTKKPATGRTDRRIAVILDGVLSRSSGLIHSWSRRCALDPAALCLS